MFSLNASPRTSYAVEFSIWIVECLQRQLSWISFPGRGRHFLFDFESTRESPRGKPRGFKTEVLHFISRVCPCDMSRGDSKEKAIMGAAAPKPPLVIPPHSKLWGFLAFSRETTSSRACNQSLQVQQLVSLLVLNGIQESCKMLLFKSW